MRTAAHGLSVDVPLGWEARIMRPAESAPYLHVASFALTADSGQFGAGVTATMQPDGAFAALVEYVVDRHVAPESRAAGAHVNGDIEHRAAQYGY